MNQNPQLAFTSQEIRAAGKKLAGPVNFSPETRGGIEIYAVANAGRASHVLPMRSVRTSVRAHMRQAGVSGDMASRAKRMQSIRRKLADPDLNVSLDKMQDLSAAAAPS